MLENGRSFMRAGRSSRLLASLVGEWMTIGVALAAPGCHDFEGLTTAVACALAHPPPSSDVPASAEAPAVDFTAVVWQADLGDRSDGGPPPYLTLGFDLDDACTTASSGFTCVEPAWATAPHADGPGGVDNAVGQDNFAINAMGLGSATDGARGLEKYGTLLLAIRVRGYNQTDYGNVDVAYYGVRYRASDGGIVPRFDGTDAWDVYTGWLQSPDGGGDYSVDQPLYHDPEAYVTTGPVGPDGSARTTLVSKLPALTVGGSPPYHLRDVVMTADVVPSGSGWTLANVVFGARVGADALLEHLVTITDMMTHDFYCQDAGQYDQAKQFTCAFADIRFGDDGGSTCDGVSWGWRYDAAESVTVPLGIGPASPPEVPTDCPPERSPLNDTCGP